MAGYKKLINCTEHSLGQVQYKKMPITYMSIHVLSNLIKELRKRKQSLSSILSLFCNEFNKLNNTGAGMLDSIYHMTLKLLKITVWCEDVKILPSFTQR